MKEELYCKVFVQTGIPKVQLTEWLLNCSGGHYKKFTIYNDLLAIDVKRNEFASGNPLESDFIKYAYYLDIAPVRDDRNHYVAELKRILNEMRAQGWEVVAACNFEDELDNPPIPPLIT